jgi:starch-binding outer membrane protein, SusD/RagB family
MSRHNAFMHAAVLVPLSLAACNLDVPDLNNPGLDELENNPTAAGIESACTGLLIGNRRNLAAENGLVDQLGILGREALNVDGADPRYTSEMLAGTLSPASPFGGNFWAMPYANIRLANIVLAGVDKVGDLSAAQKAAIRGYTHTIEALDLLEVIVTHDTNGAVIDTDHPLGAPLGAIAERPAVYAEIVQLLEDGATDLAMGGDSFPFALAHGFHMSSTAVFDTPAGFLKFNRAMRARVAAYLGDYATVLSAISLSFIDDTSATIDFDRGVYHVYSTKTGDQTNGLINVNIHVDPPVQMEAQTQPPPGGGIDARFDRKVGLDKDNNLVFNKLYGAPDSPVAIIRNEELILLKAEALFFNQPSDPDAAITELNKVRTQSGLLAPLGPTTDRATFVAELLYERRYSLLFESGHRWIDLRRFGIPLPLDKPTDVRNVRYPIPIDECDARPGDAHCQLGSTD